MPELSAGDTVVHTTHGQGVIVKLVAFNRARVRFGRTSRLPVTVSRADLRLQAGPEASIGGATRKTDLGLGANDAQYGERAPAKPASVQPLTSIPDAHACICLPPPPKSDISPPPPPKSDISSPPPLKPELPSSPPPSPIPLHPKFAVAQARKQATPPQQDQQQAWQTLEALRLGVVPSRQAETFTVSRDKEIASLQELLQDRAGCRVIWGDYGTGKTHLLDIAERIALEQNFVTARFSLDPKEIALHQPARIYQSIMSRLRCLDSLEIGFEPVLDKLIHSQDHTNPNGPKSSRFFSPYLTLRRSQIPHLQDIARDYIRGDAVNGDQLRASLAAVGWQGPTPLHMPNYRTFGRMYIHLITTLASYCKDAGYEGLVLLLDEVERVEVLDATQRNYAFEALKHFAAVTMDEDDLCFDPEDLYKGGHSVHRALPLCFEQEPPLSLILALTPLEEILSEYADITESEDYDIEIGPLNPQDARKLVQRVAKVYRSAYPAAKLPARQLQSITHNIIDQLEDENTGFRSTVRSIVFQLDELRFYRQAA